MRAILAALILATASIAIPAMPAYADGIDRPRAARPAPRPRPPAVRPAPAPVAPAPVVAPEPETVTLSQSFFSGGVGADVGMGFVGGGGRVIVQGASATAIAFSSARASASAGARGGYRGGHGGGGGCGCR